MRFLTLILTLLFTVLAVPPLLAQTTAATSPWWLPIVAAAAPIVTGYLAKFLADGLKQILPAYDNAPSLVKSVVSVLIGLAVGWLSAHLALATPLGADLHGWSADTFAAILTALVQAGIYRLQKNQQLASQGAATMEQRVDGKAPKLRAS